MELLSLSQLQELGRENCGSGMIKRRNPLHSGKKGKVQCFPYHWLVCLPVSRRALDRVRRELRCRRYGLAQKSLPRSHVHIQPLTQEIGRGGGVQRPVFTTSGAGLGGEEGVRQRVREEKSRVEKSKAVEVTGRGPRGKE